MGIRYIGTVLVTAASIAGCASTYAPPTSGDTAHITFSKYKDSTTSIQTYDNAETCSSRHSIALMRSDSKKTTVAVKASEPLSITMSVDRAIIPLPIGFVVRGCNATVTFAPKNGASYAAELVTGHDVCLIKLKQINADETTADVPESSLKIRNWKRGFDESSSFCD
ncbi:hypothetical protein PQR14_06800 [Paraburkholderia bryophila]|uniref:hypothetical protein n=1 Tax=Burkholderiaceae TaxID=119060 RepID=UPI00054D7D2A|nr:MULTISPECIES: hypothetical protein [Burkholderiaceae]